MSTATDLLLIRSGITYRQLDHWVRKGWVKPRFLRRNGDAAEGGSGYTRDFSEEEARVVLRMGRLVNVGLKAEEAALAARSMVDRDEDWVRLDGGVTVTLDLQRADDWAHPTEQHTVVVDDPPPPPAETVECCASGSCEVCQPHRWTGAWST